MRSKYKALKRLSAGRFRRLTGIFRETFVEMVGILRAADIERKSQGGRPNDLCIEDRLLLMLEYYREYRTFFHVGESYGVSESSAWRICRWTENVLIKSGKFSLPGKKALIKSDTEYEVILMDASESPIERPKKRERRFGIEKICRSDSIQAKRNATL